MFGFRSLSWIGSVAVLLATFSMTSPTSAEARFAQIDRLGNGRVDWVSVDGPRIAFGSAERLFIATVGPPVTLSHALALDEPALEGLLFGPDLYLAGAGGRLRRLDLASPFSGAVEVHLEPRAGGALHLARMDDFMVVTEEGWGLHVLRMPPPDHGHGHARGGRHDAVSAAPARVPTIVASLPLDGRPGAVAAAGRRVYVAVENGLAVVDTSRADTPVLVRTVPLASPARALAANGDTVWLLGSDGLRTLDDSEDAPVVSDVYPDVRGSSLYLGGRVIHVAGEERGLLTYRDRAPLGTMHAVTVGDFFFDPPSLTVDVGDTVVWSKPVTTFPHNVRSCTPAEPGCSTHPEGDTAAESFFSAPPTASSFVYDHTFTSAGTNPYLCQAHNTFMRGTVFVDAAAASPPGVPDGSGPTLPLTVAKGVASSLVVSWDATTCVDAADHQLVHGDASTLPSDFSGTYGLDGSVCGIGTSGQFVWAVPPAPAPGAFVWFLVVADNGPEGEGSWGKNSGDLERAGPGPGGSSGTLSGCNDLKSVSNLCGQ